MGMQTAYLNQPYAASTTGYPSMGAIPGAARNTLASYVIPLSAPPAPAASQSMTQLPNVPRPPFLNSLSNPGMPYSTAQSVPFAPAASTSGGLGSLPDIPTPAQLLGTASAGGLAGSQGAAFNTGMPATTAMTAGPYPNIEALPEIPPPHIAAPWVYLQRGKNPPQLPLYPYGYGGAGTPAASQPQAKSSLGQPGNTPMGAPQPPPQPPVQGTPQAPPPQQPPQQPPAQPQQKKPSVDLDEDALSDETIKALNKRLEDPVEGVRSDATIDLFKILDKNPKLADNPNYKPYIDAFVEKIMQDPSPVVRAGGELILKMGEIPNPSPVVQSRLNELSQKTDLTSEGAIASDILRDYETGSMKKKKAPPPPDPNADQNQNPNAQQAGANPDKSSLSSHKNTMSSIPLDGSGLSWQSGPIPGTDVQPPAPTPPPADPPPDGAALQFSGKAGNKLNMMSPQQAIKAGPANSTPAGQRLNIQGV